MTIIVYRNGWCYADEIISAGDMVLGRGPKIAWRKKDGAIIGASGAAHACQRFIDCAMKGGRMPKDNGTLGDESCNGLIFHRSGEVESFGGDTGWKMGGDFFALGATQEVAIGALMVGATAKEACRAACNAAGWVTGLHGVNHDGQWDFVEWDDGFLPIHGEHTARTRLTKIRTGYC